MRSTLLLLPLLLAACQIESTDTTDPAPPDASETLEPGAIPEAALVEIDSTTLRTHIAELASDEYEGRGTGTPGEERTIEYIAAQMEAAGLEGGAADGSFFQPVPLRGNTLTQVSALTFTPGEGAAGTEAASFQFGGDGFIASTDLDTDSVSIENAELVFVGYGISNPGYNWDDFKDVDVTGKVLVGFVNDPPATEDEPNLFQADTLTYNGRWTYKYEEARRRGALGVLLIHTDETAGYPFQVLTSGARDDISLQQEPEGALQMKGWIPQPVAERLAQMAGTSLDAWFELAATRAFEPQPIPATVSLDMQFESRRFEGTNVIGKITGRLRPEEAVVYTAHHDHLGKDDDLIAQGQDGIYNGAVDNASGVSMMLVIAEAFQALPEPPVRSVYFLTLSAEESGLLGSSYYAENPVVPLARTIANVNVDSGNLNGPTDDIVGIGAERSEMMRYLREAAAEENMTVTMDPSPNQGIFFRSDQLAFARGGVPAVFIKTGTQYRGQPEDYAAQVDAEYRANRYHQPADEYSDDMPLGGLVQQTRVAFRLGHTLSDSSFRPQWNASEAFAETRAQSEAALR